MKISPRDVAIVAEELIAECREFIKEDEPPQPEQLYKLPFGNGYIVIGQKMRDALMYLKNSAARPDPGERTQKTSAD